MEFNEKLQELRKRKGLTQEALAEALFVSRTAVSKWESGRGLPSIDSLKAIAKFFSVTVDELLSGEQVLSIAEAESREKERRMGARVFALLDLSAAMFFFLPFFGQKAHGALQEVSLLALTEIAPYLRAAYFAAVIGMIAIGILSLALRRRTGWLRGASLGLNAAATLLFIIGMQPYAAAFLFVFLLIKVLMGAKRR